MNVKMILAMGLVALSIIAGLVSLGGSTVSTVSFAKVPSSKERLEVYGVLDKTSIRPLRGAHLVQFDLVEEKTGVRLPVLYQNNAAGLPGNFPAASHARAAGTYDPTANKLVADRVLTKCPSKYEEKSLDLTTKDAVDQWRKATGQTSSSAAVTPAAQL